MSQVADAAGVSMMTVSYTYSQPDRVSVVAAGKVRAAAARLGYPGPHPGARSLRLGRTGSLGIVIGERLTYAFEDPQAARFLAGVAQVCAADGVGLTLVPITGAPSDSARVVEAAVDGFVLWTTTDDDPVLDAVLATGLPAVVLGGPSRPGLSLISIDDHAAATAVGRLAFAGARRPVVLAFPTDRTRDRLLYAGPPPSTVAYPVTRNRWHGYQDAWAQLGGDPARLRIAVCTANSAVDAESYTRELLASDDPPDAIAAMSDELALGALRAAEQAGVTVPGALAITGWDDTPAAEPAGLSTVAQSLRDQGIRCAHLALGRADPAGDTPPDWRVVHRRTTKPAGSLPRPTEPS